MVKSFHVTFFGGVPRTRQWSSEMRYEVGMPVKTHDSFTKSITFCQILDESEMNTIRDYTDLKKKKNRTLEKAREQEEPQNQSWALSGSMWCSIT